MSHNAYAIPERIDRLTVDGTGFLASPVDGRLRPQPADQAKRSHLYEIDLVRAFTALCVVGVHAIAFTLALNGSAFGSQLQDGVVATLHFARETFLAVTAFVLVYGYARRPLNVWAFWRKRGLGVLLPYVAWSVLYVWLATPGQPLAGRAATAVRATLTGTASYQLYFILLSLELYLVLPLVLAGLKRVGPRHPWRLLLGSGALQVVMLFAIHRYLEAGPFPATPLGQVVSVAQSRFLPFYQFYVVFGGLAALHLDRLHDFVVRHGRLIVAVGLLGLGALWLRYGIALWVQGQSDAYAISVFQPVMALYAATTALFLYWLGVALTNRRDPARSPSLRLWSLLASASFGIYLIHPLVLDWALEAVPPTLPTALPVAVRVGAIWGLTGLLTAAISAGLLYLPGLSRLVGHPCRVAWGDGLSIYSRFVWRARISSGV